MNPLVCLYTRASLLIYGVASIYFASNLATDLARHLIRQRPAPYPVRTLRKEEIFLADNDTFLMTRDSQDHARLANRSNEELRQIREYQLKKLTRKLTKQKGRRKADEWVRTLDQMIIKICGCLVTAGLLVIHLMLYRR